MTFEVQLAFLAEKQERGIFPYYVGSCVSGQDEPNFCAVIGYPSRQDGAISSARDYPLCPVRIIIILFIV